MITLTTLAQATQQEVFEQVAKHLLQQKQRCVVNGKCMYRGRDGLKCAAGSLISDEEYKSEMDSNMIGGTAWSSLVREKIVPEHHSEFIRKLQKIHDSIDPTKWEEDLISVAREDKLDYSFLNN